MANEIKKSCLELIEHVLEIKKDKTKLTLVGVVIGGKKVGDWEIIIKKKK